MKKIKFIIIIPAIFWISPVYAPGASLASDSLETTQASEIVETLQDEPVESEIQAVQDHSPDGYFLFEEFIGEVSAYNSVPGQTDDTPCIGAFGYLCDRTNIVANNFYKKGTLVEIDGEFYEVFDRMNKRYGKKNFDIYFGMDVTAAKNFGRNNLNIKIYKRYEN